MPRQGKSFLLLDRENANIIADAIDIAAYDYIVLEVASSGTATGLLQFLGASNPTQPDWSDPATDVNLYTGIRVLDLDTGAGVSGATGVNPSGTDIVKQYKVNVDHLKWLTVKLSGWSAGFFTVRAYAMARDRLA